MNADSESPGRLQQPTLETPRLILRPLALEDAPLIAKLAGKREIADTTISISHPYCEQQARDWIKGHIEGGNSGKEIVFAVLTRQDEQLVGTIGLRDIDQEHSQAEMGFWVAVESWGQGYATEAARRALQFGFEVLKPTGTNPFVFGESPVYIVGPKGLKVNLRPDPGW